MSPDRFVALLERAIQRYGSLTGWSKSHGLSVSYVSGVLSGRHPPGPKLAEALGYEQVVSYRKVRG